MTPTDRPLLADPDATIWDLIERVTALEERERRRSQSCAEWAREQLWGSRDV